MRLLFSVEFFFRHRRYFSIVRVQQKEGTTEYFVRVMNARLNRLLYGCHIFKEEGDAFAMPESTCTERAQALRMVIEQALQAYVRDKLHTPESSAIGPVAPPNLRPRALPERNIY